MEDNGRDEDEVLDEVEELSEEKASYKLIQGESCLWNSDGRFCGLLGNLLQIGVLGVRYCVIVVCLDWLLSRIGTGSRSTHNLRR